MDALLTMAQMRDCEDAAIASGQVTGAALMERAGAGVVAALQAAWPQWRDVPGRALVLCGQGNNGGDGFVIARLLHGAGWRIDLLMYGEREGQSADAAQMRARWEVLGTTGRLGPEAVAAMPAADLVIDAVFGAGRVRPIRGVLSAAFRALAHRRGDPGAVVAVDTPSGLCLDSGFVPGQPRDGVPDTLLRADVTVTFHRARPGHYLGFGPDLCGRLVVADIGLDRVPDDAMRLIHPTQGSTEAGLLRKGQGHKYRHGHALILSGPAHASGAARLASRAALRVGAGVVTLGAAPADLPILAPALEAVMLREVADGAALAGWLQDDARINALALGPGLGFSLRARGLLRAALQSGRPTVLDADALTLLAQSDDLQSLLHPACILTPHEGEFARLAPDLVARTSPGERSPLSSRAAAARQLAARLGVTVLLKGRASIIADPSGKTRINAAAYGREAPWLATAGAGDVLTGLIAGLLARGLASHKAASLAAYLHVEAARAFGPGLIASDLPDLISQALTSAGCAPQAFGLQDNPTSSPPA